MSQAETQALLDAVQSLEDTDFEALQAQLPLPACGQEPIDVIICCSHCAAEN